MKKFTILALTILTLLGVTHHHSHADDSTKDVAAVTSFTPRVGSQLFFEIATVVSNTKVRLTERVTIKSLEKDKAQIEVVSYLEKNPNQVIKTETVEWQAPPAGLFDAMVDSGLPIKAIVIGDKSLSVIVVSVPTSEGTVDHWIATDGKKIIFPTIVKKILIHDPSCEGHTVIELKRIVE